MIKVAFVYPWATFGGVERILLNRVSVLQQDQSLQIDIIFEHDSGAGSSLRKNIRDYNNVKLLVGNISDLLTKNYNLVFCIDFPEAIDVCERKKLPYLIECHTGYSNNRTYLKKLSSKRYCKGLIFPSAIFLENIKEEIKDVLVPVFILNNFVKLSQEDMQVKFFWKKRPVVFLGRLDILKNVTELLTAYCSLNKEISKDLFLILAGPISQEVDIRREIEQRNLISDVVLLPSIPFDQVSRFIQLIRKHNAIFISPSQNESFGLSAAEMIVGGVPVVLSNIDAHIRLVDGYESVFTYPLGDSKKLSYKIEEIVRNYEEYTKYIKLLGYTLSSSKQFLESWRNILMLTIGVVKEKN